MAPIAKTIALAGALYSVLGFAAPMQKRAVQWETVTDVVWTTIDVTTTLYPQQLDAATATVVPVTTTAPAVAAVTTTQAAQQQPAQQQKAEPETTSSSSTSTVAPAPAPTEQTTQAPAPAVTTTSAAPSSTSEAPAAPSSSSSSQSSGYDGSCDESSPCTGQMTYYDTATTSTNPSSCGTTNDGETEFVLALPHGIMTDGDCGKSVTIEYNGVTQTGTVVDKCMGCDDSSVDLSRALFGAFASLGEGRLSGAKWYIN